MLDFRKQTREIEKVFVKESYLFSKRLRKELGGRKIKSPRAKISHDDIFINFRKFFTKDRKVLEISIWSNGEIFLKLEEEFSEIFFVFARSERKIFDYAKKNKNAFLQ